MTPIQKENWGVYADLEDNMPLEFTGFVAGTKKAAEGYANTHTKEWSEYYDKRIYLVVRRGYWADGRFEAP